MDDDKFYVYINASREKKIIIPYGQSQWVAFGDYALAPFTPIDFKDEQISGSVGQKLPI